MVKSELPLKYYLPLRHNNTRNQRLVAQSNNTKQRGYTGQSCPPQITPPPSASLLTKLPRLPLALPGPTNFLRLCPLIIPQDGSNRIQTLFRAFRTGLEADSEGLRGEKAVNYGFEHIFQFGYYGAGEWFGGGEAEGEGHVETASRLCPAY